MSELQTGRYRHYKGGEYEVLGTAQHSETSEKLVVYKCLYDGSSLWVRPLAMFKESLVISGEEIPRFQYMGDGEVSQ